MQIPNKLHDFTIYYDECLIEALKKIELNLSGFVIVLDKKKKFFGILTDGDIRRNLLKGRSLSAQISECCNKEVVTVNITEELGNIIEIFKNQKINFIPIVDNSGYLRNVITKKQMHAILLQDLSCDLSYDFSSVNGSLIDYEIFKRPWGYYKTTVLTDYYQSKIISITPQSRLSLQSHRHREEYWIIVHGNGEVILENSILNVKNGSFVFIPKGCKHRAINTSDKDNLIISEIQIGDYFGEDDIIRYEDVYGRI